MSTTSFELMEEQKIGYIKLVDYYPKNIIKELGRS